MNINEGLLKYSHSSPGMQQPPGRSVSPHRLHAHVLVLLQTCLVLSVKNQLVAHCPPLSFRTKLHLCCVCVCVCWSVCILMHAGIGALFHACVSEVSVALPVRLRSLHTYIKSVYAFVFFPLYRKLWSYSSDVMRGALCALSSWLEVAFNKSLLGRGPAANTGVYNKFIYLSTQSPQDEKAPGHAC